MCRSQVRGKASSRMRIVQKGFKGKIAGLKFHYEVVSTSPPQCGTIMVFCHQLPPGVNLGP
jgi:hypothetical protein